MRIGASAPSILLISGLAFVPGLDTLASVLGLLLFLLLPPIEHNQSYDQRSIKTRLRISQESANRREQVKGGRVSQRSGGVGGLRIVWGGQKGDAGLVDKTTKRCVSRLPLSSLLRQTRYRR